jgi:hypothetical protein
LYFTAISFHNPNIYKIVSNNTNKAITDKDIVKLSLPFGDINSTPEVMMDMLNAIPTALISVD